MATGSIRKALIVGLGNHPLPDTRHNVGMMVLDHIARWKGLTWTPQKKCKGWVATVHESVMPLQPKKTRKRQQPMQSSTTLLLEKPNSPSFTSSSAPAPISIASALCSSHPFHPAPAHTSAIASNPMPEPLPEPVRWEITLLKPKVWMNESGQSVAKAVKELNIPLANIIIVHDDMQRDIGKLSLKQGGSAK
ncbi:hypothetical protein H4R34_001663 [Dimargaris verticillata]|uniref:Peptidyl-tRNA hydrolase n=1 Tax=Dimargaris verticillata TaxID=2761393 RepID=A0A9W8EES0_9FUNG|nr:hypothetical protein H4R34_001663 [Dimargaris verticillata]